MNQLKKWLLIAIISFVGLNVYAQVNLTELIKSHPEYYFNFNIESVKELQQIDKIISIDKIDGNNVTAYANEKQYQNFLSLGYEPVLMVPPSLQEVIEMIDTDELQRGTYEWDSYPTYEAYEAMMYEFAADHPDKCTIVNIGTLNSGRKLLMANINNGSPEGLPKFLYTATMHGDETTGYVLMLRLIDYLLSNYGTDPRITTLVDNLDIWINPLANPDGTFHGGNNTVNGSTRYNANGVDLNRNYADPDDGPHPDGEEYQGETVAFMQFADDYQISMSANFHGGAEVINYPWDTWSTLHADDAWWQMVSREYATYAQAASPSGYMTYLNNGITNGYAWYTTSGSRQDYMNYYSSCRELTAEISDTKTLPASQLPDYWNYNVESLLRYMEQCFKGIHGIVTDSETGEPIEAQVFIENHDVNNTHVYSILPAGDYHRPIKGGTWDVTFSAEGYYPQTHTITIADNERVDFDVQLSGGELIADFEANTTSVSANEVVSFTNTSWGNNITSYEWTFEGGTPSTSTVENPQVTYTEVGNFDVSLTITNAEGTSSTMLKEDYINVALIYSMPQSGTSEITTCDGIIYDNGGANNNYSGSYNGILIINPSETGAFVQLEGTYDLESNYDYLYIYDGAGTNGTPVGTYSGSGNISMTTSTTGALTLKLTSDYSVEASGFELYASCDNVACDSPTNLSAIAELDDIAINLAWNATPTAIEYMIYRDDVKIAESNITEYRDSDLQENTTYCYYIIAVCDNGYSEPSNESCDLTGFIGVDENSENNISVYPNPTNSSLTISGKNIKTAFVRNTLGQLVKSFNIDSDNTTIDVSDLSPNVYLLEIQDIYSNFVITKFVVK